MNRRLFTFLALAFVVAVPALTRGDRAGADDRHGSFVGAVYTMSNDAAGNSVLTFFRLPNGKLLQGPVTPTGGSGTGGGWG